MTTGLPSPSGDAQKQIVSELALRADFCRAQGLYSKSEVVFCRALELAEQIFADDDSELLLLLNNFAVLYKYSGRFDDAERMYRRALWIAEKRFGECHATVATLYHNLMCDSFSDCNKSIEV
jgi:tetratricopeptide (TPR) repeat protein